LQFGTNHLGHFLLTNLLLREQLLADGSRIVVVASRGATRGTINFDDLMFERTKYSSLPVHCQSKLANVLFALELQRRLTENKQNITAYSLHPGAVRTELSRNHNPTWVTTLFGALFKTPFEGAQTTLYCTMEPSIEHNAGRYFADCVVANVSKHPQMLNVDDAKRLWAVSEKLVGF